MISTCPMSQTFNLSFIKKGTKIELPIIFLEIALSKNHLNILQAERSESHPHTSLPRSANYCTAKKLNTQNNRSGDTDTCPVKPPPPDPSSNTNFTICMEIM